jgi:hypothetical protein
MEFSTVYQYSKIKLIFLFDVGKVSSEKKILWLQCRAIFCQKLIIDFQARDVNKQEVQI